MTVASILQEATAYLDELERERDRLATELVASQLMGGDGGYYIGLLEQIDRFVGEVFSRLHAKAIATADAALAGRLRDATRNILAATRGTTVLADDAANRAQVFTDVTATVDRAISSVDPKSLLDEIKAAKTEIMIGVGVVVAVVIVVFVVVRR